MREPHAILHDLLCRLEAALRSDPADIVANVRSAVAVAARQTDLWAEGLEADQTAWAGMALRAHLSWDGIDPIEA